MLPRDLQQDERRDDPGPLDPRTRILWIHANFIKELQDLSSMSSPDISASVSELPVPQDGDVGGMTVDDIMEVFLFICTYCTRHHYGYCT